MTVRGTNQFKKKERHFGLKTTTWMSINAISILLVPVIYFGNQAADLKPIDIIRPIPANAYSIEFSKNIPNFKDQRATKLYKELSKYNSPLASHVEFIVAMADKYAIDYTAVVSVSFKESTYGLHTIEGSHNAWGYMAWDKDGSRHLRKFKSWREGIEEESKLLGKSYRLNANRSIGAKYCPAFECSNTWAEDVTTASERIQSL